MKFSRLFFLTIKRYIKYPAFLLLLLMLPIAAIFLSKEQKEEKNGIFVGYCFYDEEEPEASVVMTKYADFLPEELETDDFKSLPGNKNAQEVLEEALFSYHGMFEFISFDSIDEMILQVEKGELECAYLIPINLYDYLFNGEKKNRAMVFTSPSTTLSKVATETIYSMLYTGISRQALTDYFFSRSAISKHLQYPKDVSAIEEIYQTFLTNGSTFDFEYVNAPEDFQPTNVNIALSPLRGIFALLILLASLVGAFDFYKEAENPIFARKTVRLAYIMVPTLFCGIDAVVCLAFSPFFQNVFYEISAMLLYCALCIIFTFIMANIIKRQAIYYACLPIFLFACLLLSPIFFDFSAFLPVLKPLSYLFLPTYYLRLF
ncbi:MAG: hypothetical protein ACI4DU_10995 [Lachnospiraceae bacterium]